MTGADQPGQSPARSKSGVRGATQTKTDRETPPKPVEVAHNLASRLIHELIRVESATHYFTMLHAVPVKSRKQFGAASSDVSMKVARELGDALAMLRTLSRQGDRFDEAADQCLRTTIPHHVDAARLVLRLKRIAAQVLVIFDEGDEQQTAFQQFWMGLGRGKPVFPTSRGKQFAAASDVRASRVLSGLKQYVSRIDLPALNAELDAIRLRLKGPFVPSWKQRKLHETLEREGPLTRDALAAKLGIPNNPNHLYDRHGLSELMLLDFVGNLGRGDGYFVANPLPPRRGARR